MCLGLNDLDFCEFLAVGEFCDDVSICELRPGATIYSRNDCRFCGFFDKF
jgi:hypothetical protein